MRKLLPFVAAFVLLAALAVAAPASAACTATTTCQDGQVVSCSGTTSCTSKCGLVNCDGKKTKCNVPCCSATTTCEFGPSPISCDTHQNFDCSSEPGVFVHCNDITIFCESEPDPCPTCCPFGICP